MDDPAYLSEAELAEKANQLVRDLQAVNPGKRFAIHRKKHTVGIWNEEISRFQIVASVTICRPQTWVWAQDLLVNGKPAVPPEDWTEVL